MIKEYVNQSKFIDRMTQTYDNTNFSYDGKVALFEYLEQLSEDTGEDIEFDPIALCCEYSEYKSAVEASDVYGRYYDIDATEEEKEASALEFLQNNTQVIQFKNGVIIQNF